MPLLDPQLPNERDGLIGPLRGRHHVGGAAVRDQLLAVVEKFVALGVSAEIVVIVEDQDAGIGAGALAIQIGRGEAAQAAAHDDEVIALPHVLGAGEALAIPQGMSALERAGMLAAHAGAHRRIAVRRDGAIGICEFRDPRLGGHGRVRARRRHCAAGRNRHALDEVAPLNRAPHAQVLVSNAHSHVLHESEIYSAPVRPATSSRADACPLRSRRWMACPSARRARPSNAISANFGMVPKADRAEAFYAEKVARSQLPEAISPIRATTAPLHRQISPAMAGRCQTGESAEPQGAVICPNSTEYPRKPGSPAI